MSERGVEALLVGTARAMVETFGSTAHGARRSMSRQQAKRRVRGDKLIRELAHRGIVVRAASRSGVAEEAGFAYKDVDALERRRLASRRQPPAIGNVKG